MLPLSADSGHQMPEGVPIKSTQRYQCEQLVCGR